MNPSTASSKSKIRVIIRKRPLMPKEIASNEVDICEVREGSTFIVRELKERVDLTKYIEEHTFEFDASFGEKDTNFYIYQKTVRPLVDSVFETRSKVTCFAYGQTGSGKTYTMIGDEKKNVDGLYLLAANDIYNYLRMPKFQNFKVNVAFFEIYCGKLHDLLNNRKLLHAREDGRKTVNIVGLTQYEVTDASQIMEVIKAGMQVRVTGETGANLQSSRSHAILQIKIMNGRKCHGKLSFIDLAGNERGADTKDTDKQTRIDGAEINKSLLALKECIRALDMDKSYTPFRGSKLTRVLKDSFVGNCKTVMIGNVSPSISSCENTLNTLRYADRVKELRRGPKRNKGTAADSLARQLMLPRRQKNSQKVSLKGKPYSKRKGGQTKAIKTPTISRSKSKKTRAQIYNNLVGNQNIEPEYKEFNPSKMTNNPMPRAKPKPLMSQLDSDNIQPLKKKLFSGKKEEYSGVDINLLHEKLISQILVEEEEVIREHKGHIDSMFNSSKMEAQMLEEVDKPGSEINVYVENLEKVLNHQLGQIGNLSSRLNNFKSQLQEEQRLSKICQERQQKLMGGYDEEKPRSNVMPLESSNLVSPLHNIQENYNNMNY